LGAALGGFGGLAGAPSQAVGLAVNLGLVALGLTVLGRGVIARLLGMALAATLCLLGARVGLPYFTLPFVLATWALLLATRPPGE
jgi:urea transporter